MLVYPPLAFPSRMVLSPELSQLLQYVSLCGNISSRHFRKIGTTQNTLRLIRLRIKIIEKARYVYTKIRNCHIAM